MASMSVWVSMTVSFPVQMVQALLAFCGGTL
jgi:hypothetical protein